MTDFSPREIVSELDRFIVGQTDAKRAVAMALRNRWRRLQLDDKLREEVLPKNILMIGPTGVGKTEISRRLARLAGAPFLKVEATKFTEVGYVGRDVEQIIRDLVEISIALTRDKKRKDVQAKAELAAEERVLDALVGPGSSPATRESFRRKLRAGEIDDKEIEIEVQAGGSGMPMFEIPGMPGAQMGAINIGDIFGKLGGGRTKTRRVTVKDSHGILVNEESDKLLDDEQLVQESIRVVEQNGIVFLDEIDKIAGREGRMGADVSREGVQRDLLPLIEGTTVNTKHGPVKTDHILFIASGAFHISKPSDLLPELQGRLPIRVELSALSRDDMRRILTEPEASLIKQYVALLATEGVTLDFSEDAIDALADIAVAVNSAIENIGARRLQTVMERVLDEISFSAPDRSGETVKIDAAYVEKHIGDLAKNADLAALFSDRIEYHFAREVTAMSTHQGGCLCRENPLRGQNAADARDHLPLPILPTRHRLGFSGGADFRQSGFCGDFRPAEDLPAPLRGQRQDGRRPFLRKLRHQTVLEFRALPRRRRRLWRHFRRSELVRAFRQELPAYFLERGATRHRHSRRHRLFRTARDNQRRHADRADGFQRAPRDPRLAIICARRDAVVKPIVWKAAAI